MAEAQEQTRWTADAASADEISPVTRTVIAAIAASTGAQRSAVQPGARLADLAVDDLDVIELMIRLEDELDIEFPANAGLGLDPTCAEVVALVQRMIAVRDGARP